MRRRAASWMTAAALTLTLVACADDGPGNEQPGSPTDTPTTEPTTDTSIDPEEGPGSGSVPGMEG